MGAGKNGKWRTENIQRMEPPLQSSKYISHPPDEGIRAYLPDVRRAIERTETVLVDVRSPKEFSGEITAPPEYPSNTPKEAVIFQEHIIFHGRRQ